MIIQSQIFFTALALSLTPPGPFLQKHIPQENHSQQGPAHPKERDKNDRQLMLAVIPANILDEMRRFEKNKRRKSSKDIKPWKSKLKSARTGRIF